MNQITPPPKIEIIPSSAPFSEAQRSWLNGFFAGLLTDNGAAPPRDGDTAWLGRDRFRARHIEMKRKASFCEQKEAKKLFLI